MYLWFPDSKAEAEPCWRLVCQDLSKDLEWSMIQSSFKGSSLVIILQLYLWLRPRDQTEVPAQKAATVSQDWRRRVRSERTQEQTGGFLWYLQGCVPWILTAVVPKSSILKMTMGLFQWSQNKKAQVIIMIKQHIIQYGVSQKWPIFQSTKCGTKLLDLSPIFTNF